MKQHKHVNYLGCVLDETMLGEIMAHRVIEKINSRVMSCCRKNWFLDVPHLRVLYNALIQCHFDCCLYYVVVKPDKEAKR